VQGETVPIESASPILRLAMLPLRMPTRLGKDQQICFVAVLSDASSSVFCNVLRRMEITDRPELPLLFEQRLDKPGQFRLAPGASVFKLAFPAVSGPALLINQSDSRPNTLLPLVPVLQF
jgi:hypothetical protein